MMHLAIPSIESGGSSSGSDPGMRNPKEGTSMRVARCAKVNGCPPMAGRNRSHRAARPVACLRGMKKANEFVPFVISAASDRTVRATSMVDSGMSTPRSLRIRATIIAAPSEWPPYDRKLAVTLFSGAAYTPIDRLLRRCTDPSSAAYVIYTSGTSLAKCSHPPGM